MLVMCNTPILILSCAIAAVPASAVVASFVVSLSVLPLHAASEKTKVAARTRENFFEPFHLHSSKIY